jgi:hypothetical protein
LLLLRRKNNNNKKKWTEAKQLTAIARLVLYGRSTIAGPQKSLKIKWAVSIFLFFLANFRGLMSELIVAGVMTADYSLLDGTAVNGGLKLTATLDRSRYRHEPYPRYHSTKVVT